MALRLWSYVDFVIIVFNILIAFTAYDRVKSDSKPYNVISKENMRIFESIVIIFMWFKSLYYL
jgi:hypothetical protein